VTVNAVSGYTGGGRKMIKEFEAGGPPYRAYALGQQHKHPPEMMAQTGLSHLPLFTPAVGNFAQGMLVEVPLPLWALPGQPRLYELEHALFAAYDSVADEAGFVQVIAGSGALALPAIEPEACNGTNRLELFVFGSDEQARLVARLDNLGKGASGAAVQNLNLVIGAGETMGLCA